MLRGINAAVVAASFGTSRPVVIKMVESWSRILRIIVLSDLLYGDRTSFMLC